jgi:hypothetical protein
MNMISMEKCRFILARHVCVIQFQGFCDHLWHGIIPLLWWRA